MPVQPTSWITLNNAKILAPIFPKLSAVESIADFFERAPIYPAKNKRLQPITCPIKIARVPFAKPSGAK